MPNYAHKIPLAICTPMPLIKTPTGNVLLQHITVDWHRARMKLGTPMGFNMMELGADGMEVGDARNKAVKYAQEAGCEYLFFLDSDVLISPKILNQLIYRATATHKDYDVFSGVYTVKDNPSFPIIFKEWNTGCFYDWNFGDVLTSDKDGIVCVPMGCCLIRLSIFDKLPFTEENPWFKTSYGNDKEGTMTEDVYFCKRVINENAGKILVDCSHNCICGHQDLETGIVYTLEEDSPPCIRAGLRKEVEDETTSVEEKQ